MLAYDGALMVSIAQPFLEITDAVENDIIKS